MGEPVSSHPTTKNKISIGEKNIRPILEKKMSNKRIIFYLNTTELS